MRRSVFSGSSIIVGSCGDGLTDKLAAWRDRIIPLAMEWIVLDVDCAHLRVRDFDSLGIAILVEAALHIETDNGLGGSNKLDDDLVADQRLTSPILGDKGEEAVLYAVPFAGSGRMVDNRYGQTGFIGETLQFVLP